ncbi:MAG: hypothetical protein KC493_04815 [Bacteriovoracaceae bacterium]|nr:hypothetical protein [Bacteriovoracaceae bacterium]
MEQTVYDNDLKAMIKSGINQEKNTQHYFGHGKLLLSGEYFVLDGAKALALPTKVGQSMTVKYSQSFEPILYWKSYDVNGKLWLEAKFEFWHFDCLDSNPKQEVLLLQKILRQARKQNNHFLREGVDVLVETSLGFPLEWGLGSSSTLIYNIAQWAYISPFELLFKTYGGSGYDIACAQSEGPIVYHKNNTGPNWSPVAFNPTFRENLYFVYLGKKQNTGKAIEYYNSMRPFDPELIMNLSTITDELMKCSTLEEFEFLLTAHENLISKNLKMECVKEKRFTNYWGAVKSLGAWGGDFVLVTSDRPQSETVKYFEDNGHSIVIPYDEIILTGNTPQYDMADGNEYLQ